MEVKRGTGLGAGTREEGMTGGGTGARVDPETESAAVPHTALCHVTERILEIKETAGGGEGTGRRSAGVGPDPRLWRSCGGSLGNSTLWEKKTCILEFFVF